MYQKEIKKSLWKLRSFLNLVLPGKLRQSYQSTFLNHLKIHTSLKNKRILIVGVGTGKDIPSILNEGAREVTGVDPYPVVRDREFGDKFRLVKSTGESIPLEDSSFDIVYSIATLEHVKDPEKVVQEMVRLLKKDGIFYCHAGPLWYGYNGFHMKADFPLLNQHWFHLLYSREELSKELGIEQDVRYQRHLEIIYKSDNYNRLPIDNYHNACAWLLKNCIPLEIEFHQAFNKLNKLKRDQPGLYHRLLENNDLGNVLTDYFIWVFMKK